MPKHLRRVANFVRLGVFLCLGEFLRALVPCRSRRGTLVLKIDALGDLFIWLSSGIAEVASWARVVGDGSVAILVREELAAVVESLDLFDTVLPLNVKKFRSNLVYRFVILSRLRRAGYQYLFQLRIAREFLQEDAIVRAVAAPSTFGVLGDSHNLVPWQSAISDRWYTSIIRFCDSTLHELERNSVVTKALTGVAPERYELPRKKTAENRELPGRYFVIAPGAGWMPRQWSVEKFAEVARRVLECWGIPCIVVGTDREADCSAKIVDVAGAFSLCGKLTVLEMAEVVRSAMFVVGNESGVVHIAAYLRVPSVVILGGGHFGWFMPYPKNWKNGVAPRVTIHAMQCFGCNWRCIHDVLPGEAVPCIANIDVESVWREISDVVTQVSEYGNTMDRR